LKLCKNRLPCKSAARGSIGEGQHAGVLMSATFIQHPLRLTLACISYCVQYLLIGLLDTFRINLQERWGEAARRLADVLNDDTFRSIEGKSKHQLWLELCDLITKHPADVLKERIDVDAILRGGIRKYKDEVRLKLAVCWFDWAGRSWKTLVCSGRIIGCWCG
jgi:hypothetical protein